MGVDLGELKARLTAEATQMRSEVQAVKKDLSELGEQGKRTATGLNTIDNSIGKTGPEKIMQLAKTLDNLTGRIDLQKKKLAELRNSFETTFDETKKGKINEQILKTEASIIRLENSFDTTAKKLWEMEGGLESLSQEAQQTELSFNNLDSALKEIGLSADQIKLIKNNLNGINPKKLEDQLNDLTGILQKLGLSSSQIEKIVDELKNAETQSGKTKKEFASLAAGLAALGAGASLNKLVNVVKSLSAEALELQNTYRGLNEVSKSVGQNQEEVGRAVETLVAKGFMDAAEAANAYKTALAAGYSLEESTNLINALGDAAAYNREAHLGWGEAVVQAIRGIKQQESSLTDAAGITTNLSVMYERYAKSIGKTAAKLSDAEKRQAAYNGMMQESSLFAGNAETAMQGYAGTQAYFNQTLTTARQELGEAFLPIINQLLQELGPIITKFTDWVSANQEVVVGVVAGSAAVLALITVLGSLVVGIGAVTAALGAMNIAMGPIGWAIAIISTVAVGVTAYSMAADTASGSVLKLAKNQEELNKKLEQTARWTTNDVTNAQADMEKLNKLLEERQKLQAKMEELRSKMSANVKAGTVMSIDPNLANEINKVAQGINDIDKSLRKMDFDTPEKAAEALKKIKEETDKAVPALLEMKRAELQDAAAKNDKIKSMERAMATYEKLNSVQKLDENQKQQLIQVTNTLKAQYPDLHALMDSEGRIRIDNIDTVKDQISVERQLMSASVESARVQITNLKNTAAAQRASVESQIKNYQNLIATAKAVAGITESKSFVKPEKSVMQQTFETLNPYLVSQSKAQVEKYNKELDEAYEDQNKYAAAELEAKRALARLESGGIDAFKYQAPDYGTGEDSKKTKSKKEKKDKSKTSEELRKEAYDLEMATARYNAEYYDQTAAEQIAAYEKIRTKHKQHLKESLDDEREMNLLLKRLNEDSAKSRYEISSSWVTAEDKRMQKSGKSEIEIAQMKVDAWSRVRDRYAKDSEYYKDADDKLFDARKALIAATEKALKDLYSTNTDFLKQEERRLEESGANETEIAQMKYTLWAKIRDSYSKDSDYYKQADDQVYQAKKDLINKIKKDNEDARKKEKSAYETAKKDELADIADRKKAYTDSIDERIAAIDRLIKAEDRLNSEQDYESQLAEKKARQKLLEDAVSPEGRKEYADITKEIERMELEHSRDIRKQNLEDQKQALQDEKSEREKAFDKEKEDVEKHYASLTEALDNYQDDVKLIEAGIQDYRVEVTQTANAQILSDLDTFVADYNKKLASITMASAPTQQANDLQEYNANKDAWDKAKKEGNTAEMKHLNERNEAIRKQYGIVEDTGKLDKLPSYDVGGRVKAPWGMPQHAIVHGGEAIFNPQQLDNLFKLLEVPRSFPTQREQHKETPVQHVNIDMSVGAVEVNDSADAELLYASRERTARRLAAAGGGTK